MDGDNKDEIALNSRLQIRLFNNPDTSTTDVTNYAVESKAAPFQIGNLDRIGSALAPTLSASLTTLLIPVQAGTVSNPYAVEIRDSTSSTPIDFYVYTLPAVPYVAWSTNSNTTPATLQITVDATDMLPNSLNGTNVMVDTNQFGVDGAPVKIELLAKTSDGIIVRPHSPVVFVQPCTSPGLAPREVTIEVLGTFSSTFDARVSALSSAAGAEIAPPPNTPDATADYVWPSDVPWITAATSLTNTVPATITLTIDPNLGTNLAQARVAISATVPGVGHLNRNATVTLVCTDYGIYLPVAAR